MIQKAVFHRDKNNSSKKNIITFGQNHKLVKQSNDTNTVWSLLYVESIKNPKTKNRAQRTDW